MQDKVRRCHSPNARTVASGMVAMISRGVRIQLLQPFSIFVAMFTYLRAFRFPSFTWFTNCHFESQSKRSTFNRPLACMRENIFDFR
mmetsp:Transcript_9824/g.13841  ORF Transcript_9824/g.13841 Transcript_9824/m.13841 type:complete len:87 (+) Transcript_9824:62-322(+)